MSATVELTNTFSLKQRYLSIYLSSQRYKRSAPTDTNRHDVQITTNL